MVLKMHFFVNYVADSSVLAVAGFLPKIGLIHSSISLINYLLIWKMFSSIIAYLQLSSFKNVKNEFTICFCLPFLSLTLIPNVNEFLTHKYRRYLKIWSYKNGNKISNLEKFEVCYLMRMHECWFVFGSTILSIVYFEADECAILELDPQLSVQVSPLFACSLEVLPILLMSCLVPDTYICSQSET